MRVSSTNEVSAEIAETAVYFASFANCGFESSSRTRSLSGKR